MACKGGKELPGGQEARRPRKGQVGKKLPVAVVMGASDGGCDEQVLGNIEAT